MDMNWVTFHISNMEKSLHFYCDLLGMEVAETIHSDAEITMLKTNSGVNLELIRFSGEVIENPGKGVSVGLTVENHAEVVRRLKENQVTVTEPFSPNPHLRFCFAYDPDGYAIQLVEHI